MWKRILLEAAVVTVQTALLIALSATVGISRSAPSSARAESDRPLGLDLYRPVPEDNPVTPEKVRLGRRLFREQLLSRDRSLACGDCHQPELTFADGRATSVGVNGRVGPRSVATLINKALGESFFWDGHTETPEEQVLRPLVAELEMDLPIEEAVERLTGRMRYRNDFHQVFNREVNSDDLARALAAYVRTIQAGESPFDRCISGNTKSLNQPQIARLRQFRGKANCTACHVGPTLSDEEFHNTGVAWRDGAFQDEGRYAVTNRDEDLGKFKTPTLREIASTAPYMDDGTFPAIAICGATVLGAVRNTRESRRADMAGPFRWGCAPLQEVRSGRSVCPH